MKSTLKISGDLVNNVAEITGKDNNIEKLIEQLLLTYLEEEKSKRQDVKDLQILNDNAEYFDREAQDVLAYQVKL